MRASPSLAGDASVGDGEWEMRDFSYESLLELGSMVVKKSGVSAKKLAALPLHTHGSGDNVGLKGEKACCICLEDFAEGDTVVGLPCSHSFHFDCAKEWLKASQECPLCRKEV